MYRILVAEMDQSVTEYIRNLVKTDIKEAMIVSEVSSGNDVISEMINLEPDLIIIAIKITGLNGLEVIKQIRKINQSIRIIIISAYDYFEFAREAMKYHVSDYLLKPIQKETFIETLHSEFSLIQKERQLMKQNEKDSGLFQKALQFVEQDFIYSVLFNENYEDSIGQFKSLLPIEESGYIMNIELEPFSMERYWDEEKGQGKIIDILRNTIKEEVNGMIGPELLNHILVFVSYSEKSKTDVRAESIKRAGKILKKLYEILGVKAFIGIGSVKPIHKIHMSYQESLQCLNFKHEAVINHVSELKRKPVELQQYVKLEQQLIEYIRYAKKEAHGVFSELLELLHPFRREERANKIMELLTSVAVQTRQGDALEYEKIDFYKSFESVAAMTREQQDRWAYVRFEHMMKSIRTNRMDRKTSVINDALNYIQNHYKEDISLNQISMHVSLSPQHFSKIFKEETNVNYVEYVAGLRISKAKELLNNTNNTIKEVCFMVGYQDPNYFSRIFKRYVGVSPTEYLKERMD